jgi:hypothetical protein
VRLEGEMLNFTQNDLETTAQRLLDMQPDPVPRFRLLRDVLRYDPADAAYQEAERGLGQSKWVSLLADSQWDDGTWGRFHTQDTSRKQPFPTTESAIAIALELGLDRHSSILQKAMPIILDYVDGKAIWPDPPEKHDNPQAWYVWVWHFSAAILALIDPHHARLDEFWALWAEALQATFQSGTYDRQEEIVALNALMRCRMKNPVPFHVRYPLLILSATHNRLSDGLERRMLDFVMHFGPWFYAHRLLSRFRLWKELAVDGLNWIWKQRTPEGFWDFGSKIGRKPYTGFPLSESWRQSENRIIDCTTTVLGLLSKCFDGE